MILTASVSDGSLSHLGSESGKVFLENHDDIKSQFLGFCLKSMSELSELPVLEIRGSYRDNLPYLSRKHIL